MSEPDELDYADEVPHPRVPQYSYRRDSGGKFDGTIKAIGITVITAAVLGLVGMVFAINETNAVQNGALENLRLTDQFVREQIADVKGRQDRIEGRVYRSDGSLAGDFGAEQRQP